MTSDSLPESKGVDRLIKLGRTHAQTVEALLALIDYANTPKPAYHRLDGYCVDGPLTHHGVWGIRAMYITYHATPEAWAYLHAYIRAYGAELAWAAVGTISNRWADLIVDIPCDTTQAIVFRAQTRIRHIKRDHEARVRARRAEMAALDAADQKRLGV